MKKLRMVIEPTLRIRDEFLSEKENLSREGKNYFPNYIINPISIECGFTKFVLIKFVLYIIGLFIRLGLRPRKSLGGDLNKDEVEEVYNKEAGTYNTKHHLTTRGQDLAWRRQAAYSALNYALQRGGPILDICAGTGLTILEMINVFEAWGVKADITGLDYNERMLELAKRDIRGNKNVSVRFVRGDATNMTLAGNSELSYFKPSTFGVITQMFGIGGVDKPLEVFKEVIRLLKPSGHFFLIDMHRPVPELSGEWPILYKWWRMPLLESMCYQEIVIPLALKRLWAWRDTTNLFYLLRLITLEINGENYGFRVLSFDYQPQRWWLSLPIMTIASIIVEKIKINRYELEKRKKLLHSFC